MGLGRRRALRRCAFGALPLAMCAYVAAVQLRMHGLLARSLLATGAGAARQAAGVADLGAADLEGDEAADEAGGEGGGEGDGEAEDAGGEGEGPARADRRRRALPARRVDRSGGPAALEAQLERDVGEILKSARLPFKARRVVLSSARTPVLGPTLMKRVSMPEEDLLALLPEADLARQHRTCAVVGNSGISLQREMGPVIDSYDAVFRYNNAPTRGWEKHVGSKTTYRSINNAWSRTMLKDLKRNGKVPHRREGLLCFGNSSLRVFLAMRRQMPSQKIFYVAPELTQKVRRTYRAVQAEMERRGYGPYSGGKVMPSGFEGIFFMIQVCEEVQVYGFDPQTDPDVAYHYFDRVRGVTRVHSFPFQFDMLHALHVAGLLKLFVPRYVGDTAGCRELSDAPASEFVFADAEETVAKRRRGERHGT